MIFKFFLFFFFLIGNVYASNEAIVIKADTLKTDKKNLTIKAKGNVEFSKNEYKINADEVEYNKKQKKIYLNKRAKMTDNAENKIFAESGEVDDDIKKGEFKNAGIILKNGVSITSPKVKKESDDIFVSEKANFFFCKDEGLNIDLSYEDIQKEMRKLNKQIVSISSKSSTINREKSKIYFNHAFLKVFNIPIFYIPFFSTSSGLKERASGMTSPKVYNTRAYGTAVSLGYRWYLLNNLQFMIKPTIFTKGNFLINSEFGFESKKFNILADMYYARDKGKSKSILNDDDINEFDEGEYRNNRYYLNFEINGIFDNDFFYKSNINFMSDNYFLRDYLRDYDNFLNSDASVYKGFEDSSFLKFSALDIKQIRETSNKPFLDNPDFVYDLNYYKNFLLFNGDNSNINFNIDTTFINVINDNKDEYDKFNFTANLNYNTLVFGGLLESNIKLLNDYYFDFFGSNGNIERNRNRTIPEFSLKYQRPIFFNNISIKPIIEYYYSYNPNNNKNFFDKDSKESILSINNIFSDNRYSGNDLLEFGNRINYGLDIDIDLDIAIFNFTIAQGYRDKINKQYQIANFEEHVSDVLTSFNIKFDNLYFDYIGTIDKEEGNIKRNELLMEYTGDKFNISSTFVYADNGKNGINTENQRQLNIEAKYKIDRRFSFATEINNDLKHNKITYIENSLIFQESCVRIELGAKKHNYIDSNERSGWDFSFSLRMDSF